MEDIVPYTTSNQDADDLPVGETRVAQVGEDGYTTVTYKITYHDLVEESREETNRVVTEPVNEIIDVGTKVE